MPKSSHSKQLNAEYGGFHDLPTFRAESGLTDVDISDVDALRVINEDMQEQKRIADAERNKAQQERAAAQQERAAAQQERDNARVSKLETERVLEAEKAKRRLVDNVLLPIGFNGTIADYYAKEKLKQEVKDDLLREQRLRRYELEREKELEKMWKPARKPRAPSKSRSARPKSKSRSKSKPKTKSKTKSKTKK